MNKFGGLLIAGVFGTGLILTASPAFAAGAAPAKAPAPATMPTGGPAGLVHPDSGTGLPPGYLVVTSQPVVAGSGGQTHGYVTCPAGRMPSGGGAFVDSSSLGANINSSYPLGANWEVDVNNTGGYSTSFTVYAICLSPSRSYTVASATSITSGHGTTSLAAQCPSGTQVTGGGAISDTLSTTVNINSTVPNALPGNLSAWRVAMSSSGGLNTDYTVYAVCQAKPAGWSMQFGGGVTNPAGTETEAVVSCPANTVPIGGGGFSSYMDTDTSVDMNTTYPVGHGWDIYENNGGSIARGIYASVICAS